MHGSSQQPQIFFQKECDDGGWAPWRSVDIVQIFIARPGMCHLCKGDVVSSALKETQQSKSGGNCDTTVLGRVALLESTGA